MNIAGTIDSIIREKPHAIWSVAPDSTVYDCIQLMSDKNIGAVLVVENGKLGGVFTERDYTRKIVLKGRSSKTTPVREVLSRPVISVKPEDTIEDCMRLMTEHRIRHLPVMEGDRIVGIVSIGDLVNWIISAQHVALNQMEAYISGQYPG